MSFISNYRDRRATRQEFSIPVPRGRYAFRAAALARDAACLDKPTDGWDTPVAGYKDRYEECWLAEHDPKCLEALGSASLHAVSDARITLGIEEVAATWESPVRGVEVIQRTTDLRKLGAKFLAFTQWATEMHDGSGRTIAYGYATWNSVGAIPVIPPDETG
jgi:hypothetical protein